MSADREASASPQRTGQWEIVRRQFYKKTSAVWGLRVTLTLAVIAIYTPIIASSEPLVWRAPGGELEFPWFRKLFDVITWEHALGRVFNLLMVALSLYAVLSLLLRFAVGAPGRRRAARRSLRAGLLGITVVIATVQSAGWGLTTSEAKADYQSPREEVRGAARRLSRLEEDGSSGEAIAAAREELAERRAFLTAHTIVTTPIPYGYREQRPFAEDKFLASFSFVDREAHLFGTDETGRDVFARILYGTRISLTIGIVAVAVYVTIGTVLGALAGYFGGRIDLVIMRVVEVFICIPGLFLMLTIVALFEKRSVLVIMFAIGVVGWTTTARLVRGEFLRERTKEYVLAARALGSSSRRIIFRHMLPNALGPVLVAATFGVPAAILAESGLSFLGLGDVSVPSWGRILYDARTHEYWHLIVPPALAIFVTVTALNLVGDGLRDALDPKLRR